MGNVSSTSTGSEIAVIGMSGRFPGATNLDQFWRNLSEGVESIYRFTDEELARAGEAADLLADAAYVRARPVLANVDQFDAEFFGFSPQDAAIMDPQHRIFLEVGWEALERAGYDAARFTGQVGVFATCGMNSYMMYHLITNPRIMRTVGEWLVRHTGNDMSFLATGLSYHLNLKGPSMSVQCACSSALVAIHLAAQSLLSGECDMAMAGGSVVVLPQDRGYLYQSGEIMARDGHCRAFDANATGTLFGSGAGVVVLRRLADAIEDGDPILAVIKGSAVNNDGSMKVGFLAPSVEGQSRVIAEALAVGGIEADTVSYIEAHGTGTVVGDPIEVTALTDAFRRHTARTSFCRIGSLKSNIGHLGEAAGVAAFIKTVLSLQHRQLPPTLNYETPNPQIDFAASPFVVNDTLTDWTRDDVPRRAGITALGAGGTNCHVIVEEAPEIPPSVPGRPEQLLVLSARTVTALESARANLAAAFESANAPDLADAAYTLQVGRVAFAHRWSGVAADRESAVRVLKEGGVSSKATPGGSTVPVVFLFPGGGAQYPNMGRDLYEREPVFRADVDKCLHILRSRHGVDLGPIWFPQDRTVEAAAAELARSTNSILSVFIVEYALSRLWMSWGVTPSAMSGHSLGEYTAACLAGVFSLEDALTIVKARGDVFERLPAGSMLSVLLPEAAISTRLSGRLSLAAVNASTSCVVSGPTDDILALSDRLSAEGIETQRLHIDVAAHSPMLDAFLAEFRAKVSSIRLSPPSLPFVSNLTGRWISREQATDPGYWVDHLRQTVRFSDGLATILANPNQVLLEVGPGRALTSLARLQPVKPLGMLTSLRHPSETLDDVTTVLTALGRLWTMGVEPTWTALHGTVPRRRVALPTYPFERRRHWVDAGAPVSIEAAIGTATGATDKRPDVANWFSVPTWRVGPTPAHRPDVAEMHVLVFADAAGTAAAAVSRMRNRVAGRTWVVEPGRSFSPIGTDRFTIDPTNADDYVSLFAALGTAAHELTHVLHAWNLGSAAAVISTLDSELDQAFFGPLALAQAIGRQELDQPLTVLFIASGTAEVAGEGGLVPARTTLIGPSRVMPREFANVSTRIIDVIAPSSDRGRDQLAGLLALELGSASHESRIAYRGVTRWVEHFEPRRLPHAEASPLRHEGVYLITGGMGGLGLELAAHLAETVRARLVLVGRTPLPPRQDWQQWLSSHGDADATSARLRRVLEFEALGAKVEIATADVVDQVQLAAVREHALAAFGAVHGIFHTAGALDDGLMMTRTRESALAVLKPKVHGTAALQAVFADDPLDFVVLFSSISSVLGLQGQVDYTAANAYLDAVADHSAAGNTRFLSINWGPWKDVGLAVSAARDRARTGVRPRHPWLDSVRRGADGKTIVGLRLAHDRQWMIAEHVVRGSDAVLPGTGYLELARAALEEIEPGGSTEIADVIFRAPVIVPAGTVRHIELLLTPQGGGYSCSWQDAEEIFATARVTRVTAEAGPAIDVAGIRQRCAIRRDAPGGFLEQPFMDFGPRWANIREAAFGQGEALLSLQLPDSYQDDTSHFLLHPAMMDMATGGAQALIPGFSQSDDFYVPISYGTVRMFAGLPPSVVSHVRLAKGTGHEVAVFDITIATPEGAIVVEVTGFCMKRVAARLALSRSPKSDAVIAASDTLRPTSAAALANDMLQQGILVSEGVEAVHRALGADIGTRVMVSTADIDAWLTRIEAVRAVPTAAAALGRTLTDDSAVAGDVRSRLARMWSELLGVTSVQPGDNFFELGGHSLLAVRLVSRIEKQFRCTIPFHQLFSSGTMEALALLIESATSPDGPGNQAEQGPDDDLALTAVPRDTMRLRRGELDKTRGR